jgi:lipase chaperone LimK
VNAFARSAALSAAVLGVALTAYWLSPLSTRGTEPSPSTALNTTGGISLLAGGGSEIEPAPASTRNASPPSAQEVEHALFVDGSLRGAALDGGWGRWTGTELLPSRELRRRFDQLLTTVGERRLEELRVLVGALAERDLGPQGSAAVLAVWDRYLKLQQHRFSQQIDPLHPEQWSRVLAEHQQVRRELLGFAWADAFYAEEEASLRALMDPRQAGHSGRATSAGDPSILQPPGKRDPVLLQRLRVATLGAEAAARLEAEDQTQAAWTNRLNDAHRMVQSLENAPELSAEQREQAIKQWMKANFTGSELVRANALLGL